MSNPLMEEESHRFYNWDNVHFLESTENWVLQVCEVYSIDSAPLLQYSYSTFFLNKW